MQLREKIVFAIPRTSVWEIATAKKKYQKEKSKVVVDIVMFDQKK